MNRPPSRTAHPFLSGRGLIGCRKAPPQCGTLSQQQQPCATNKCSQLIPQPNAIGFSQAHPGFSGDSHANTTSLPSFFSALWIGMGTGYYFESLSTLRSIPVSEMGAHGAPILGGYPLGPLSVHRNRSQTQSKNSPSKGPASR